MTIQAITFDFWSTLYRGQTVDYTQRLLGLKEQVEQRADRALKLEQFKAAVGVARDTWGRTWVEEHRTIGANEWLGIILSELSLTLAVADSRAIETLLENSVLDEPPTLVPEAKSVLTDLAATHRLAIISDTGITPGSVLRQFLEQDNIIDLFSHLTFSDEIGRSKPHPDAFLTTLAQLDAPPNAAIHIGDLLRTDIMGAQQVGMRGVQYVGVSTDDHSLPPGHSINPDAVIDNHTQLFALLDTWQAT